jgi:hypothetical protein
MNRKKKDMRKTDIQTNKDTPTEKNVRDKRDRERWREKERQMARLNQETKYIVFLVIYPN